MVSYTFVFLASLFEWSLSGLSHNAAPAIPTVDSGGALSSLADPLIPTVVTPYVQILDSSTPDTATPPGESKIEVNF